jgi:O-antigen ligase
VGIGIALALAVWCIVTKPRVRLDPGGTMFLLSFAILAVLFAITAREGSRDLLYSLNFALFVVFVPLSSALQRFADPGNTRRVAWFALAGVTLCFTVALVRVLLGHPRADGFGSNPIASATVALLLGFICLMGYEAVEGRRRYLLMLGPLLGLGTLLMSESRGPLLAVPALLVIAAVLIPFRRAILVGAAVALFVAGGLFLIARPDMVARYLTLVETAEDAMAGEPLDSDRSVSIRSRILNSSYLAFLDSPWIGHGWGGRVAAAAKYAPNTYPRSTRTHLHSDILNFGVAGGVVGLLALLLALAAPIVSAVTSVRDSQYRWRLYGALVLSATYGLCGAVNMTLGFEYLTTFYVSCAAIICGFCRDPDAPK